MDQPANLSIDYLNLLPDEILLEILIKTDDFETLSGWCQTSKRINNICQDKVLWKQKYKKDFGGTILYEGETWQEQYKRAVKFSSNSPISSGNDSYGIIDQNGKLYMSGNVGLLGIGIRLQHHLGPIYRKPRLIRFPQTAQNDNFVPTKIVSISISSFLIATAAAVTENGNAYVWGNPKSTSFGFQRGTKITPLPRKIILPAKAIKISVNRLGYIVLLEDSSVWLNIGKKLGVGNEMNFKGLLKTKAIDISIGPEIYAMISKDNWVFVGGKKSGYRGHFIFHIKFPEPAKRVIAGTKYIMVLSITGKIYELPISNILSGNTLSRLIKLIKLVKIPEPIVQISSSSQTFATLSETGKLYMWGYNNYEQISGGLEEKYSNLVEISFGLPVNFVSVGQNFTIAVSNDGMVNYWGDPKLRPR